jgi:hypothetical protein
MPTLVYYDVPVPRGEVARLLNVLGKLGIEVNSPGHTGQCPTATAEQQHCYCCDGTAHADRLATVPCELRGLYQVIGRMLCIQAVV